MSQLKVALSLTPAQPQWGDNAILSFDQNQALIHLPTQAAQQRRVIQKAARKIDAVSPAVQLEGEWTLEQQWAFALAYGDPKRSHSVSWCENDDKDTLSQMYNAHLFTRDLVNATPEDLSPVALAKAAQDWLSDLGGEAITCNTIVGEALPEAGWHGIYQVGRGSERPPVLLEVDYNPTGDPNAPVAVGLVGKGITFDSGGYSLKPSESMVAMKCDMGGAATVTGGLGLAIMQGLKQRVKLFLCCAENLVSGHAYKLGDIITYKNGVTVEIVNTDAEGRLVLADGLMAAGEAGAGLIVDAATLTGAAVVALGGDYNAVFSLNPELSDKAVALARSVNEPAWPLPLESWHSENCPSPYAVTANSRAKKGGGAGGASNAAGFLSRFVPNEGENWLHFDLAAAFNDSATSTLPAGATAHGIRTIAALLAE